MPNDRQAETVGQVHLIETADHYNPLPRTDNDVALQWKVKFHPIGQARPTQIHRSIADVENLEEFVCCHSSTAG